MIAAVGRVPHRDLADLVHAEATRKNRRRVIWPLAAIVVIVSVVLGWVAFRPRPVPLAGRFRFESATRGDVVREVRATGHAEAVTTVQVGAEISGRIATVEADYNDVVKTGQVLARFDREALTAQKAQAFASLTSARASLEQARTDHEHLARDLLRVEQLHKSGVVPDADYDNSLSTSRMAADRVLAAEANLGAQQAAYAVTETSLEHSVIHSPIDGTVISRNVDPGQTVASVFQTPVLFTVAADLHKMRVIAAIDESDIGEVALRQRASFTVTAYIDRVFEGVVSEIRNLPVVVQDVVTYAAVIDVNDFDLALKPGMTASVRVRTAEALDTMRVPSTAIRFTPPGENRNDKAGVWILEGRDFRRVDVTPGVSDGELTSIASGPLASGQLIIVDLTAQGRKAYAVGH